MKKIILFLALALGVEVNAQVVGGYLPVNSTKSATMGGLRVNGTSTFTGNALFSSSVGIGALPSSSLSSLRVVNSTSTVDIGRTSASAGAIWLQQSSPTSANYALNSDGSVVQLNSSNSGALNLQVNTLTKLGLNTGGATVTGSLVTTGTHSLGSANLTGGNTGTVAVLSDAVFAYDFQAASAVNPNDATSYYFSNLNSPTWLSSASANSILMPYNATLIGYHINYIVNGVTGTAETATLQISASGSATNLVTSLDYQGAANSYTANNLSVNVTAGSLISAVLITPTWVTNPTNIRMGITFLFVRRS